MRRIGDALTRLKTAAAKQDLVGCLEAKTEFYAALIGGCRNSFIERMLKPLHHLHPEEAAVLVLLARRLAAQSKVKTAK